MFIDEATGVCATIQRNREGKLVIGYEPTRAISIDELSAAIARLEDRVDVQAAWIAEQAFTGA